MPRSTTWLSLPFIITVLAACGSSSPETHPESPNSDVTVGGHVLVARSVAMFSGEDYYDETVVVVTDHPDTCGQIALLDACDPETDLYIRRIIDAPPSVTTALVISAHPAAVGTFGVALECYAGTSAQLVFAVHDDAGSEFLRDEAVQGTVVVEELQRGVSASGRYDVVLASGAAISGRFAGDSCSAMSAFAVTPPNRVCGSSTSSTFSLDVSASCTCRGQTVQSSCARATLSDPWTCQCTDAVGATTTCTLPADATQPPAACSQPFTCCPLRF